MEQFEFPLQVSLFPVIHMKKTETIESLLMISKGNSL